MIRVDMNKDGRCEVELNGERDHVAFEFAVLTSKLAVNTPEFILKKAFEDGLYINEHGMETFGEKLKDDIEVFDSIDETFKKIFHPEEPETEENADDNESDNEPNRGGFKDFATMMIFVLAAATLLGNRNDKTDKH